MRSIYDFVPAPIAHYTMNDILATDVIIDKTGDHPGAVKDAGGTATSAFHSVAGKINNAQDFDGGDDYIEIADHADFTPALTPFSISAWVYMHDATNFQIVSKGVYNTDGEWRFVVKADDTISYRIFDESVVNCYIGRAYNVALAENVWLHLVLTYGGGNTSASGKIYLGGIRVDNINHQASAGSFVSAENLGHAVWIGRYDNVYANGLIDNVMFFNVELTARQVMKLADFRGKESVLGLRPNRIYHENINNGIFGGVKGCTV